MFLQNILYLPNWFCECRHAQWCPTLCDPINCSPFLCPWDYPSKNTRMGRHFLFQGNFLTQGSNPGLLSCRQSPAWQADSLPTEPPGKPHRSHLSSLILTFILPDSHIYPPLILTFILHWFSPGFLKQSPAFGLVLLQQNHPPHWCQNDQKCNLTTWLLWRCSADLPSPTGNIPVPPLTCQGFGDLGPRKAPPSPSPSQILHSCHTDPLKVPEAAMLSCPSDLWICCSFWMEPETPKFIILGPPPPCITSNAHLPESLSSREPEVSCGRGKPNFPLSHTTPTLLF